MGTAGHWHPPKVKTPGVLPASRVPCDPKVWPHPGVSIAIWILLGPAEIASISVSLTRLPPECPTLGQVFRKTDRKDVLTVSCHHLVGTVVALGQAGKPQKWVHKENLSCSLISLHFPAEGVGGRTCSALVMAQHMVWGVQHPQPHTRTVPCPVTLAQATLSLSALAKTMARCYSLARKCLFPAPASTQGGNLLPQGLHLSREELVDAGADGDRSFRTTPQHKSASGPGAPKCWGPAPASHRPVLLHLAPGFL